MWEDERPNGRKKSKLTLIVVSVAVILVLAVTFLALRTNPHTPAGHEGYVKESPRLFGAGGFQGSIKGPGNFGVSLWRNQVENIDVRPKTYAENFQILAKDELNVSFRFQAIIKIKSGSVQKVVEEFGGAEFYRRYIHEPLRSMVRNNVQTLNSTEIKTQREKIADSVLSELKIYLAKTPFVVVTGVVGNIDYPKVVTDAVEKKLAADQLLKEKETQKAIAKKDAEIRIEEARGIAKAQQIINSTLTPNYLQHEAIQAQLKMATSPNHTTVYIPSGSNGIPIVEMIKRPSRAKK